MIYFCADDYGIAENSNRRIVQCLDNGALNKISVLPNGEIADFQNRLKGKDLKISLHINLVEGRPLAEPKDVPLLVTKQGYFRHAFVGLLLCSLFGKRKELEKQLYKEIQSQITFWKQQMGDQPVYIDSHQHTHMIPLIFKTLLRVIRDEKLSVERIRIPDEPLLPYLLTPSLYTSYSLSGLAKQWLIKFFALVNRKELKKSRLEYPYFMGLLFSGHLTEEKIRKVLPHYIKIAEKHGKNIEIGFHPGYVAEDEPLMDGYRTSFGKFYFSPWRKKEHNTLMQMKCHMKTMKEGQEYALH